MALKSPHKKIILTSLILSVLTSCANTSNNKYQVDSSYLEDKNALQKKDSAVNIKTDNNESKPAFEKLSVLQRENVNLGNSKDLEKAFGTQETLSVSVNSMTIKSFLHYTFGQLLNVDYVLGKELDATTNLSLNVTHKISPRRLFTMTQQLLLERGIGIRLADNIYFVYSLPNEGKSNVVLGFGRSADTIPQNSGQILQVVPLKYGVRINVERTLNGLVDAKITADFEQSALFIKGSRDQIVRALDLIQLLDVPANRGKYIALISPVYLSVENYISSTTKLLQTEGIDIAKSASNQGNLVFVPLNQLGAVAVFSSEKDLLDRVEYWTSKIDKPSAGTDRQYHIYTPRFARASDLGDSISPLLSGTSYSSMPSTSSKDSKTSAKIVNNQKVNSTNDSNGMTMVVDQRSNVLIFHASGSEYQSILPLVMRMDVIPKQVLLSVTIAEVKLTGVFKRGFEFALTSGKFGFNAPSLMGESGFGGGIISWTSGLNSLIANFIESNNQVNILSKPTLLVRDGVEASIDVGDRIPVTGGASLGNNNVVVTQAPTYRETGIKLKVTPTVNAQGVVIMKINQSISNQLEGEVGANPIFFDRNISTEVVADSGQTILLGGLISENTTNNDKAVPGFRKIPLLGALFEAESKNSTKTELVIMVTPKIIERTNQWQSVLNKFSKGLENISLK